MWINGSLPEVKYFKAYRVSLDHQMKPWMQCQFQFYSLMIWKTGVPVVGHIIWKGTRYTCHHRKMARFRRPMEFYWLIYHGAFQSFPWRKNEQYYEDTLTQPVTMIKNGIYIPKGFSNLIQAVINPKEKTKEHRTAHPVYFSFLTIQRINVDKSAWQKVIIHYSQSYLWLILYESFSYNGQVFLLAQLNRNWKEIWSGRRSSTSWDWNWYKKYGELWFRTTRQLCSATCVQFWTFQALVSANINGL